MPIHCQKCKSGNIKPVTYQNIKCIICNNCGFDERDMYEQYPEEKKSQKAKGSYSPYKTGGHSRTKR